jgi:hypothetical protein
MKISKTFLLGIFGLLFALEPPVASGSSATSDITFPEKAASSNTYFSNAATHDASFPKVAPAKVTSRGLKARSAVMESSKISTKNKANENETQKPTCTTAESTFKIKLGTDNYGDQTTIALSLLNDDNTSFDDLVYVRKRDFTSDKFYKEKICREKNKCYLFAIHDSNGDGLQDGDDFFLQTIFR